MQLPSDVVAVAEGKLNLMGGTRSQIVRACLKRSDARVRPVVIL